MCEQADGASHTIVHEARVRVGLKRAVVQLLACLFNERAIRWIECVRVCACVRACARATSVGCSMVRVCVHGRGPKCRRLVVSRLPNVPSDFR